MGWKHIWDNAVSWTLSCLLWKEWYGNVHLYTDSAGYDFLIDTLRLPYTSAEVILDGLPYPSELWVMGKVHVYGIQKEPFLHTDGDAFPFSPLPARVARAGLVAQHQERVSYYADQYASLKGRLTYEPAAFTALQGILAEGPAYNNGIIGGSNFGFFHRYAREVKEFVTRNMERLSPAELGDFNVLCEQALYYGMAREEGLTVTTLLQDGKLPPPHQLWQVRQRTKQDGYLHPVSIYKHHPLIRRFISDKLRSLYPPYFYRLRHMAAEGRLYN